MPRVKPRAPAPPIPKEDDIHAAVAKALDLLLLPPAMWTTFPAGGYLLTPAAAGRLSRLGLKRGWPDVLVLHRELHGIELKRPGGVLSRTVTVRNRLGGIRVVEGQRDMFPRLEAAGMRLATCTSVDAVLTVLRGWGVPLRAAA